MQHYHSLEAASFQNSWLTIGVFDGVHRGHQAVLRGTLDAARASGGLSVAVTFDRHPNAVVAAVKGKSGTVTEEAKPSNQSSPLLYDLTTLQREAKDGTPDWVRTVPIEHDGAPVLHHVIDDLEMLLHTINLGSIDLHPWLSRWGTLDQPDWAVLDLDPKSAPFGDVVLRLRSSCNTRRSCSI